MALPSRSGGPGAVSSTRGRLLVALMLLLTFGYVPLLLTRPSCISARTSATVPSLSTAVPSAPPRAEPSPCPSTTTAPLPAVTTSSPSSITRQDEGYHVHIVVFTYRRLAGLQRLLRSLSTAQYDGHDVTMSIFLDYPKEGKGLADDGTREFVAHYEWPHGRLHVHRRLANAGLKRTIMESWFPPAHNREVAAFFEDDIEVSPLWYQWATAALRRYAPIGQQPPRLLGVSLFRPIHDELSGRGCKVAERHAAFALQQPCSWGAVYLPGPWREFRDWYDRYTANGSPDPLVFHPGRPSSNGWAKTSSWKKYLIKYMVDRAWYMVYPNPPDTTVLATNHLMVGEHPTPKRELFELPLLQPGSNALAAFLSVPGGAPGTLDFSAAVPALDKLPVYDVLFKEVASLDDLPKGSDRDRG